LVACEDSQSFPDGSPTGVGFDELGGRQGLAMQQRLIAFHQEPDGVKDLSVRIGHYMKLAQELR